MFAASKTAAVSGAAPDDKFNYVTMLLHGDGTNGAQNNTFVDSSTNNFTITRNGNTTQGSFSPYGDNWSNYFGASSTYLITPSNTALGLNTGNFTCEMWLYPTSWANTYSFPYATSATTSTGLMIGKFTTDFVVRGNNQSNQLTYGTLPALNTWTHIAVVRSGTTLSMYFNGTRVATATNSYSFGADAVSLGSDGFGSDFAGYMSNVRLVKGTAVYDPTQSTLTVPTTPLTAISGTSLLSCQSNRFIDNSTNNFAITANGSPSVQRFNPFGTSTAYSTSVIGGSGYFDGSGDDLTLTMTGGVGSGDFTIEYWLYPTSLYNYITVFGTTRSTTGLSVGTQAAGQIVLYVDGSGEVLRGTTAMKVNTWNHCAFTRSGTTMRGYLNGVLDATGTSSNNFSQTASAIGSLDHGGEYATGFVSDLRVVSGTALYTGSTLTVPTAPLTAVSNTRLLTNMTNGAIFDNAMMNDLETVGNAQISTSVVKYGTGSLAFDETGDYIKVPPSTNMSLGTGDFTIECWVRFAANPVGNGQGMYQLTNGYLNNTVRGPACGVETGSGEWTIYYGTTYTQSGVVPTTGVWYHTAFVRYSGTSKLYVNGTSVISVSDTTNYTDQYFTIGGWYDSAYLLNGYIDDLRITKGYARYTANFTPPTTAFSNTGPI